MRTNAPWINANRLQLVSWLDMQQFNANQFAAVAQNIGTLLQWLTASTINNDDDLKTVKNYTLEHVGRIGAMCSELGLRQSYKASNRVLGRIGSAEVYTLPKMVSMVEDVMALIHSEMEDYVFLLIPEKSRALYDASEPLFGQQVFDAFPSLVDEISEAGKCLALDRGTACVFHLMRVMEKGLRSLANALAIPYAPSWESYITQITTKIGEKHKSKGVKWKRDEPFFKDILGDLTSIKVAWRNPTMHIVKSYNAEQAEHVYTCVKAFMRHIASRFKEPKASIS